MCYFVVRYMWANMTFILLVPCMWGDVLACLVEYFLAALLCSTRFRRTPNYNLATAFSDFKFSEMSKSKVAVVTGGNRGIGLAIVKRLCKEFDGTVVFTARSAEKGAEVCDQLQKELGTTAVEFHPLDVISKESIQTFHDYLKETFGGVHILVNNAGIFIKKPEVSYIEKARSTVLTNFFGVLNVSNSLFPLLCPHARVVNMASRLALPLSNILSASLQARFTAANLTAADVCTLMEEYIRDLEQSKDQENGWPDQNMYGPEYRLTKAAVIALTRTQARDMEKDSREGILINSVCPGWCRTDLGGPQGERTPEQGADTPVYCALLPKGTARLNGEVVFDRTIQPWP